MDQGPHLVILNNIFCCRLYVKHLGPYKTMSATLHALYVHGHEYLEWAQNVVGVPLGALSESAIECHNKVVKALRRMHARMDSIIHQSEDILHGEMWRSDPLVLAFFEIIQEKKRGFIRRSRRNRSK